MGDTDIILFVFFHEHEHTTVVNKEHTRNFTKPQQQKIKQGVIKTISFFSVLLFALSIQSNLTFVFLLSGFQERDNKQKEPPQQWGKQTCSFRCYNMVIKTLGFTIISICS